MAWSTNDVKSSYNSQAQKALENYPEAQKINRDVFQVCFSTISSWFDLNILCPRLLQFGVIKHFEDANQLQLPHYKLLHERLEQLMNVVEKSGPHGFPLLYICLKESISESRGHEEAVTELENQGFPQARGSINEVSVNALSADDFSNQIDVLEDRFCDLSGSLYAELCDKDFSVRDVTRLLFSLPPRVIREVSGVLSSDASGIGRKENIHELFEYLNRCLWNFIDYKLLEYIVGKVGSATLKHKMAEYVRDISSFRSNVTVMDLIECWRGVKGCPENFCEVHIKLDMHPRDCTLEYLNNFRNKICEKYLPPLSEFAFIHYHFQKGSTLLTWMIPSDLALILIRKLSFSEQCSTFLRNHNITMFSVGEVKVYPYSSETKQFTETDEELWELRDKFHGFMKKFAINLAVDDVSIDDILQFVQSDLPAEKQSILEYLLMEVPSVNKCETVYQLINELQQYTSFLDLSLFKEIVDKFSIGTLKQELYAFEKDVKQFCSHPCASDMVLGLVPKCFGELKVSLKLNPLHNTLQCMEETRKILASRLEITSSAMILIAIETGNDRVHLTIAVPKFSMPDLRAAIKHESNLNAYSDNKVIMISLDGEELYTDLRSDDDESREIMPIPPHPSGPIASTPGIQERLNLNFIDVDVNVTAELESRIFKMNGNGQYPSICMNSKGWLVQVYHKETVVNLRLRYRIGYLKDHEIAWSNTYREYSKGYYPRIAINNDGQVVTVFDAQVGRRMWYRVGKLTLPEEYDPNTSPSQEVLNNAVIKWSGNKVLLGEGRNPAIAINNNKTVAVVFDDGFLYVKTKYRIGDLQQDTIEWRSKRKDLISSQSTKHASIALNDKNQVAVGYSNGYDRTLHFTCGQIYSDCDDELLLSDSLFTPSGANYQPVISLNNKGHIVAVFHSLVGNLRLNIAYGTINTDSIQLPSIEWAGDAEEFSANGYHASVAVNDNRDFVTCHKSLLTLPVHRSIHNYVGHL